MSEHDQDAEVVEGFESPIYLQFNFTAARATSKFLRHLKEGQLFGQRSSVTGKVIIPPRGSCPESGTPTVEEVALKDTGTIISFTIVHIPIPGNAIKPPFVVANILLDGADQTFGHLVSECRNDEITIGTRVKAVWKPQDEWGYALENIVYFKPTGEPPVDVEALKAARLAEAEKYRHA